MWTLHIFRASGRLCFMIVLFHGYLLLYFYCDIDEAEDPMWTLHIFRASGRLCYMIVLFHGYLLLYFYSDISLMRQRILCGPYTYLFKASERLCFMIVISWIPSLIFLL